MLSSGSLAVVVWGGRLRWSFLLEFEIWLKASFGLVCLRPVRAGPRRIDRPVLCAFGRNESVLSQTVFRDPFGAGFPRHTSSGRLPAATNQLSNNGSPSPRPDGRLGLRGRPGPCGGVKAGGQWSVKASDRWPVIGNGWHAPSNGKGRPEGGLFLSLPYIFRIPNLELKTAIFLWVSRLVSGLL
jgi:hypothetical protein